AHRALSIERVAVPGVRVGDDRHAGVLDDIRQAIDDLAQREQAEIGITHAPRDATTARVGGGETGARTEPRRQPVPEPGRAAEVPGPQQLAQRRRWPRSARSITVGRTNNDG